jgi:hypothetical protein
MQPKFIWENSMAVDGKWEIVINSPLGAQKAVLDIATNNLSWSAKITNPLPLTLDFAGTVEGDKLSGSVKAGSFGSFPFTGSRTA